MLENINSADETTAVFLEAIKEKSAELFKKSLENNELPDKKQYISDLSGFLLDGFLIINALGRQSVRDILKQDAKEAGESLEFAEIETSINNEILTAKDALIYLENLLMLDHGSIYETMLKSGDINQLIDLVAGNSYTDFVKYINTKMETILSEGGNYSDWLKDLVANNKADSFLKPNYWNVVWSTNYTNIYNMGIFQEADRLSEFIEYGEYFSVLDSSTTEFCTMMDGKTMTMDQWKKSGWIPANHFFCRSFIAIISKYRAKLENIKPTPKSYFIDMKKAGIVPEDGFSKPLTIKNIIGAIK